MKTLILAVTLAASTFAIVPAQAAAFKAGLFALDAQTLVERRGRGCDTAQDIAEKPRCQQ